MKSILRKHRGSPATAKAFHWFKLISLTGSSQLLVQALGFFSGILVIRMLPTEEYALYTLANTMLGAMTVLADGGISNGVMALGARVHDDRAKFGQVLVTGMELRRKFAIGSLIIAVPILLYLLIHNGASVLMTILIVLALIPSFFLSLSTNILENVAKIKQDIAPLQKIKVGTNIGRLALIFLTIFIFPWAFVAILVSGLPQLWGNWQLKKKAVPFVDFTQETDPKVQREILGMVKLILPGAIYYSISGQINIWLITFFGTGDKGTSIAQVGGLERLSMILGILGSLINILIVPRFAKLPNNPALLLKRLVQILSGLVFLFILIITGTWLFSTEVLWIIGKNYSNLNAELFISIIGTCIGTLCGATYTLFVNRGWNINPVISISVNLLSIIVGAILLNPTTVMGVLYLNIVISVNVLIMNLIFMGIKIKNVAKY